MWRLLLVLTACGRVGFDDVPAGNDPRDAGVKLDARLPDAAATTCMGNVCPGLTVPVGGAGMGTLSSDTNDRGFAGDCSDPGVPEAVWKLNPLTNGELEVTITEGGPGVISVLDGCCVGSSLGCSRLGTFDFLVGRDEPVFLYIESAAPTVTVSVVSI